MSQTKENTLCNQVDEAMAMLIEGQADEALYEHIAGCDRCRDARYDAEQSLLALEEAGADYEHPGDFDERLMAALEARQSDEDSVESHVSKREESAQPSTEQVPSQEASNALNCAADEAPASPAKTLPMTSSQEPGAADGQKSKACDEETEPKDDKVSLLDTSQRKPRGKQQRGAVFAVLALSAAAAALLWFKGANQAGVPGGSGPSASTANAAWQGRVANVTRAAGGPGGLQICSGSMAPADCRALKSGEDFAAGTVLRTDHRTRARVELNDGTQLVLDRSTRIRLDGKKARSATLEAGGLVAEVKKIPGSKANIQLARGGIEVLGTKFALRSMDKTATVDVSRGAVRLYDERERSVTVRAGEEGRSYPGTAPFAHHASALEQALSWSETKPGEKMDVRGLGELTAKKPGEKEERRGVVRLKKHHVNVRIVDGFARTQIEEVFHNDSDDVLEGIYRFPIPPDAQIERLALEVDGRMEEGAFVDRDRAAAIWRGAIVNSSKRRPRRREEIVWVPGPWKDPALLEWQRGGRFELRIFPIPRRGSRRIVLTYTQSIKPTGGVRRYVYPLPHDEAGSTKVDDFAVDMQLQGHDPSQGVKALGYKLNASQNGGLDQLKLASRNFVPSGDLVVEYRTADSGASVSTYAYLPKSNSGSTPKRAAASTARDRALRSSAAGADKSIVPSDAGYVALALRPKLPKTRSQGARDLTLVVDSSRSMFGEAYRRATALAAKIVGEMDRGDRVTVLVCDSVCKRLPAGYQLASRATAEGVRQFLSAVAPDGASDPGASLREAAALGSGSQRPQRIVYIGDGTPTVGAIRSGLLAREVRRLVRNNQTVTTVAVGADADQDALNAMARAGGGLAVSYVPGQRLIEVAYRVLGASYGAGLSDVEVELPKGLVQVAPKRLDTLAPGGELMLAARMMTPEVSGEVVLRGRMSGKPFEQRYRVRVEARQEVGNAFVPRLHAAYRIADLQQDGSAKAKAEAIRLSSAFNVASKYTSLLVLESAAMFKAFGLDNSRRAPVWTGDEAAQAQTGVAKETAAQQGPLGLHGMGVGGGGRKKSAKAKPMPAPAPMAAGGFGHGSSAGRPLQDLDRAQEPMPRARPRPRRPRRRRRPMVPMRRVWERTATFFAGRTVPQGISLDALTRAEQDVRERPNHRQALQALYTLYARSGRVEQAQEVVQRWSKRQALDPAALTARADLAARNGNRERAIRLLGSVVDVRPGHIPAQKRLARLHRWAGKLERGCRHAMAVAQIRQDKPDLLADAMACARETNQTQVADALLGLASARVQRLAESILRQRARKGAAGLRGEIRLRASWQGGGDIDLALVHPDGHRVSWLGAPTSELISAEDVTSTSREGLALLGSKAGEYVIEVVRAKGEGPIRGEVTVVVAGRSRRIPFTLRDKRLTLGTFKVHWRSRLVPLRSRGRWSQPPR